MRIAKYRTELDEYKHNVLVRENAVNYACNKLDSPSEIADMFNNVFRLNHRAEEYAYMAAFSTKLKVLGVFEISHGNIDSTHINPREVFIRLLLSGAAKFVICHNHPSGDSFPSPEDLEVTKRLTKCADLMGIQFTDHIIIGDSYFSFKENGLL